MDLRKARRGLLCVFGLTFAATSAFSQKTTLTGFADASGGEHLFYLDTNSHLNQLFYLSGTSWQSQDLTGAYGGNTPNADSPLSSYVDPAGGQHVFYVDTNQHVNQLYYPGNGATWNAQDLNQSYGGDVSAGNALAGFFDTSDGSEHVFYVDSANHVNQFYYPGTGTAWFWQDLTGSYGGTTAASPSSLGAYEDVSGGEHVVFLDSNSHISQLYYLMGTSWTPQDLTALYGGNTPASTSNLTVYVDLYGGQHIVYEDGTPHLNQLYYLGNGTTWTTQDLTAVQGGNAPGTASHLASYIDDSGYEHIAYLDANQHVNQMYYPGGTSWVTQDLTGTYGGNTAGSSSVLVAFPLYFDPNAIGQHIAYLDGSDNVNQIYYPFSGGAAWIPQNLTSTYGGNAPALLPVFSLSASSDSSQNQ